MELIIPRSWVRVPQPAPNPAVMLAFVFGSATDLTDGSLLDSF
jgi:hypothetical protein